MASRGPRMNDFEEREYYPPPRRSAPDFDDMRRAATRSPPRSRAPVRELDRERELDRAPPPWLREENRRGEAGPMVLRQRDVETFDRRPRSPSPVRVREERIVRRPRSVSPPHFHDHEHEHSRTRVYERERVRSPSVVRHRSPSPRPRFERRQRSSSGDREHIRIVERERERIPSPSPSPPPPPPTVRGPTIEREVITHYRDIDHGVIHARRPSPPPAPRPRPQQRERETDIDISLSKNRTEVDIHRSDNRTRSRSRERRSHFHDDELVVRSDMDRLVVDDRHTGRRRAHSAAPLASPMDDEAKYITSKIDSRGRMGEAWHGATKDWAIVDVPPGTERVRMDGVGGGGTDTTWSKYSGVRRTQFNPERDGMLVPAREPSPRRSRDHLDVAVYDREREIDIDIERTTDRRVSRAPPPPPPQPTKDMWTEITKDLVVREAIVEMGYEFEETEFFFYVMDYLKYDDVLRLTEMSADIRRARKHRAREIEWERDTRDDVRVNWNRHRHHHHSRPRRHDDEWVTEREVVYDSRGPARGYIR